MNIVNNILDSNLVQTGLCTIVEGAEILAPATIGGNLLESVTQNEIVQTVAKTLQCTTTAFLGIWTTWNILDFSDSANFQYMGIISYTATGIAALALSIPLICELGKYLSPENKDKIENFQKSYATAMKIINIVTAGIALGWFSYAAYAAWELSFVAAPLALSAISLVSSAYTLHRNAQTV